MTHSPTPSHQHATNLAGGLKGADLRTLTRVWQHPLTHSLALRDVIGLFDSIGSADAQHNGDIRLRAGDEVLSLPRSHTKDLSGDEVILLRHFLERTGWSPDAPVGVPTPLAMPVDDIVVIIDHKGAQVHLLGSADAQNHLVHDVNRKQHDSDRDETFPADQRFFADIATALGQSGRIIVIGHGKGQADEAHHLIAWTDTHRPDIHARIDREIRADLPHMTNAELLALARDALATPTDLATTKGAL